jgi:nitroreductase
MLKFNKRKVNSMDIFEVFDKRYSCRKYNGQKVEREKLIKIVECARLAPSACNTQPWHYVIVDDTDKVNAISKATQKGMIGINKFTSDVPAFIVLVREKPSMTGKIASALSRDYSPNDIGIAIATMSYTATALGLGNCILGWFDEKKVADALNLPKSSYPDLILAVGYEDGEKKSPVKKDMEKICSINQYGIYEKE